MSRKRKVLERVLSGATDADIRFRDPRSLLVSLGFLETVKGGHHIFHQDAIAEIINLQPRGSQAKPHQVRQVRELILKYRLGGAL